MRYSHLPAILLVDNAHSSCGPARDWLRQSRFRTVEAMDAFDALEQVSDFTTETRPDVIWMNVDSVYEGFTLLSSLLLQTRSDELEYPVLALCETDQAVGMADLFEGTILQIEARLEELVPKKAMAGSAH